MHTPNTHCTTCLSIPAPSRGLWAALGGFPSTHVAFPQIFLWYHCLQLVKYFLLVPISFCTAQTLGLQEGQSRAGSVRGPTATRGVGGEGAQGLGCAGELTKQRQKGKSFLPTLQCYVFLYHVQKLPILPSSTSPQST